MKYSEAIRLGLMLRPQGFGGLYTRDAGDVAVKSCAHGAALEAVGISAPSSVIGKHTCEIADQVKFFPIMKVRVACPKCNEESYCDDAPLAVLVTHMNDEHRMTRESIASFIEGIEAEGGGKADSMSTRWSMLLSEAIILGSKLRPKATGSASMYWDDGSESGTCALGAAAHLCGITGTMHGSPSLWDKLWQRWPILQKVVAYPENMTRGSWDEREPLFEVIYTLNDCYGWTREAIAEFVAKIESEQEAVTA